MKQKLLLVFTIFMLNILSVIGVTDIKEESIKIKPTATQPVKKFKLVAEEKILEIKKGLKIPVWTYNGTVPGQEIRVTQGDFVEVELKNNLKVPITIHWHGYPVQNSMDGVTGLTQDSIKPGEIFIYKFSADIVGTYWYHSHEDSANQLDKGLYGALIVEPKEKSKIDKEFTLILDEWMEDESMDGMNMGMSIDSMNGMKMDAKSLEKFEEYMMATSYNIYTINGKSGDLITPLNVKNGDIIKLRFINAGYRSHGIHIPNQDIKVIATDGQDIQNPEVIKDQILTIAPGERYDIEFTVNGNDNFYIDFHDSNKFNNQIKIPVNISGGSGKDFIELSKKALPLFDVYNYGKFTSGEFSLNQKFDAQYDIELGTKVVDGILKYTLNGKTFDELPPMNVKTGDIIKLTYYNNTTVEHPMHIHGHFFEVLAKNDIPLIGTRIIKDTILVKPKEKYTIVFKANNSGLWVEHCHELHHAEAGMMQEIIYTDYKKTYIPIINNE